MQEREQLLRTVQEDEKEKLALNDRIKELEVRWNKGPLPASSQRASPQRASP
jgi:hypothetical protein